MTRMGRGEWDVELTHATFFEVVSVVSWYAGDGC